MRYKYSIIGRLLIYLKYNWIPIILIILAVYDLRVDIRLLLDFFTFSTLIYTISEHPLALTVLLTIPTIVGSLKNTDE